MKHKPQTLTSRSIALVVALFAVAAIGSRFTPIFARPQDDVATTAKPADETSPAAAMKKSDRTAAEVFESIAAKLNGASSLSCRIEQNIIISGQRFIATGQYAQASGNRMRLEYHIFPIRSVRKDDRLELLADGASAETDKKTATGSLLQVSDGSVLWSHWKNGDRDELTRRNISDILEAVETIPNYSAAKSLQDLGVGGLQALMSNLQSGMDFGTVLEHQAGDKTWLVLSGRWSKQMRKDLFQIPDDAVDAPLPEYVPDYVRVYVDTASGLPRRIQYLKRHADPQQQKVHPLVTLDLRDLIPNPPLDDSTFVFTRPENKELKEVDLTSNVIDSIKRIAAGPEAPANEPGGSDQPAEDATTPKE